MKLHVKIDDKYRLVPDKFNIEKIKKKHSIGKILNAEIKDPDKLRSISQLNMYFACCQVVADNFPDWARGCLYRAGMDYIDKNVIHLLTKAKYKITSVAFNALNPDKFTEFFNNALE